MAASGIVQFREPLELLQALQKAGINPNELGRRAFEKEARRVLAEAKAKELASLAVNLPKPAAEIMRDERDQQ